MNGDEKAVLIVDDEYYAVQGIAQNVKWERLGVGKTYTAYSREQAERILREHSVDILLTDIEMPGGSGLSLIEWVRKSGYTPFVLILTGHQRFDYAHKAINLRCDGYILKPVDVLEVEQNLKRLLGAHSMQGNTGSTLTETEDDEESFVARVRQTILQNLSSPELNRTFIAQKVHINEDYLSYLFHIKFGQTLSSYITFLRSEDSDKIEALDNGADDYLTKPFSVDELLARYVVIVHGTSCPVGTLFSAAAFRTIPLLRLTDQ